jgi:hypothetical protein
MSVSTAHRYREVSVAEPETGAAPETDAPTAPAPEAPQPQAPPAADAATPPASPEPAPVERPRIVEAVIDLLQTTVDWLKQEAETTVREKVALPLQKVGLAIGSGAAAGCLLVFGLMFVAIGLLLLVAQFIGWPATMMLIGAVYIVAAAVFLVIRVRVMLK